MTELLIFYADKVMVIGNSKNLHVFNFAILRNLRKSRKFDAHEIYMLYNIWDDLHFQIWPVLGLDFIDAT